MGTFNFLLGVGKLFKGNGFLFLLIVASLSMNAIQCSKVESESREKDEAQALVIKKDKQLNKHKEREAAQAALLLQKETENNAQKKELSQARKEINYLRKTNTKLADFLNGDLPDGTLGLLPDSVLGK